jgi:hypothetical protein
MSCSEVPPGVPLVLVVPFRASNASALLTTPEMC